MIIACERCKTRFNVPDDKLGAGPVRMRCSKCDHTFVASPAMAVPPVATASLPPTATQTMTPVRAPTPGPSFAPRIPSRPDPFAGLGPTRPTEPFAAIQPGAAGATMQLTPVSPVGASPFAAPRPPTPGAGPNPFAPSPVTGLFAAAPPPSARPDPFSAPAPKAAPDPFAALAAPAGPAPDPFASLAAPRSGPDPFAALATTSPPKPAAPAAPDPFATTSPPKPATPAAPDPFAALAPPAARAPSSTSDPFAAAPGPGPDPFAPKPSFSAFGAGPDPFAPKPSIAGLDPFAPKPSVGGPDPFAPKPSVAGPDPFAPKPSVAGPDPFAGPPTSATPAASADPFGPASAPPKASAPFGAMPASDPFATMPPPRPATATPFSGGDPFDDGPLGGSQKDPFADDDLGAGNAGVDDAARAALFGIAPPPAPTTPSMPPSPAAGSGLELAAPLPSAAKLPEPVKKGPSPVITAIAAVLQVVLVVAFSVVAVVVGRGGSLAGILTLDVGQALAIAQTPDNGLVIDDVVVARRQTAAGLSLLLISGVVHHRGEKPWPGVVVEADLAGVVARGQAWTAVTPAAIEAARTPEDIQVLQAMRSSSPTVSPGDRAPFVIVVVAPEGIARPALTAKPAS